MLKERRRQRLRRLLARWEIWVSALLAVAIGVAIAWFTSRVSQLFDQGYLRSYEATSLILQAVLPPLIAAPALVAALVGLASLRTQKRVQKDARRPIIDVRLTSPLGRGASQYERLGAVSVTNLGPGPGIDVTLEVRASGISPRTTKVGVLASEGSGPRSSVDAEISVPTEIIGQNVQLIATYIDLFGTAWVSRRTYVSFPTGEGPLEVYAESPSTRRRRQRVG